VVLSGTQWYSVVLSGTQWYSVVLSGTQWYSVVFSMSRFFSKKTYFISRPKISLLSVEARNGGEL
jgi:hypothetical protein